MYFNPSAMSPRDLHSLDSALRYARRDTDKDAPEYEQAGELLRATGLEIVQRYRTGGLTKVVA